MNYKEAKEKAILLVLGGSHAYGMATKDSDEDERGIVIGPIESYLGLSNFEQAEDKVNDGVIYELKKFCKLALDANPNIWDLFWSEEVRHITKAGEILKDNRDLFLSRKARFSFAGYAFSQLKRIKTHRGYLIGNHPKFAPDPLDFGIDPTWKIGKDELYAINALADSMIDAIEENIYRNAYSIGDDGRVTLNKETMREIVISTIAEEKKEETAAIFGLSKEIMTAYSRVKAYQAANRDWRKYQDWKKNRNPKRAVIENKFGYDTKHAMHLVRLLRMGREILEDGVVNVKRPDAEELLAIRNGSWTYEQLEEFADREDLSFQTLYDKSPLPKTPNFKKVEDLMMNIILDSFKLEKV